MSFVRSLIPRSIAGQITGLLCLAVLLGVGFASAILLYLVNQGRDEIDHQIYAAVQAARIAAITRQVQAATSPEELSILLERLKTDRMEVSLVPLEGLRAAPIGTPGRMPNVEETLARDWNLRALTDEPGGRNDRTLFIPLNGREALRFGLGPHGFLHNVLFVQATGALAIVTLSILFLSAYAVRWITSPLSSIASAAREFGRSEDNEPDLSVNGPREIREAASALNDMRKRVRALVRERTLMLTAISHDLRTPLTRLRLRTERVTEEPVRAAMMQDILLISEMVGETLAYVRASDQPEPAALTDLPSLLETIAAQFLDIGHSVSYRGPDRLTFAGRAQGIGRAVTNVVENGTKYGTHVEIRLRALEDGAVDIEVCDDGPGIAPALLDQVLEPFFKGDAARSQDGRVGFGLGLSIARHIAEKHGGAISLSNREPHGLSVSLTFRPLPVAGANVRPAARADRLRKIDRQSVTG
jgi:signal transduction histidine kinase